ncbi:MAG: AAA family ATPase [Bacteroidales bacterium]|jgi:MoxR-like ATPase
MQKDTEAIKDLQQKYNQLHNEINKIIIGQHDVIKKLLIAIFSRGHVLLVGVPGLAKTLMINTLARTMGMQYSRIQFTPDLMPSDIIGTEILDQNRNFKFIKGPVFANIVLADEINRTPPKTQSALLEAMQEKAVTIAGVKNNLPLPFFVLATQNPIEQEGTYPLPEAQLDRFMFNLKLDYPSIDEEIEIVKSTTSHETPDINVILSAEEVIHFQDLISRIPVADNVYNYAVNLAYSTRPNTAKAHVLSNQYLTWGAGPRASQYLIIGAKVHAAISGKYSPDIEDVKAVAIPILRHRIIRNYKAEAEGIKEDFIIEELMK